MSDLQVPKKGDRFIFEYRGAVTLFAVQSPEPDNKWLCKALQGRYKGLRAIFEQEQVLMLIGTFLHTGAAVI